MNTASAALPSAAPAAWVLTLPAAMALPGALYWLFVHHF
jgi:phosphate/sulfate permease